MQLPRFGSAARFQKPPLGFTEWPGYYCPGGFHPVSIGDLFDDGRYQVVTKLGYGKHSTVWLVRDQQLSALFALKVVQAIKSACSSELAISFCISGRSSNDYLLPYLHNFTHEGPNGAHLCLVYPVMSCTLYEWVACHPDCAYATTIKFHNGPEVLDTEHRMQPYMAKIALLHILRGIASLHDLNIVHSDLSQRNMMVEAESLPFHIGLESHPNILRRKDGLADPWSPQFLYSPTSLFPFARLVERFKVRIVDLGSAFFASEPPERLTTPNGLKSPEAWFTSEVDASLDVWSFGCLIYELFTGDGLFAGIFNEAAGDFLFTMHATLGPLPDSIIQQWRSIEKQPDRWFDAQGGLLQSMLDTIAESEQLENRFRAKKPDSIDEEEATIICTLIRECLDYTAGNRPTAKELLSRPYFQKIAKEFELAGERQHCYDE